MTIYNKRPPSSLYRKIYEQHYGPIPKEENGRSYEIHHLDGDSHNNDPSNLVAVTLQEHYDIHYLQEDFAACRLIAGKLKFPPDVLFELRSKAERKKVTEGNHHLQRRSDGSSVSSELVRTGKHHLLKRADGSSISKDKVHNKTHHLLVKGKSHPKYLHAVYKFKNKHTGEVLETTYYDFRTRFNLDPSNVRRILLNPNKSCNGWQVV
jgi:hypothetical protein